VNSFEQHAVSSYWENVVSILVTNGYNSNQIKLVSNTLNMYDLIIGNGGAGGNGGNGGFGIGNNGGFYAKDTYFSYNQQNLGIIVNQLQSALLVTNTQKSGSAVDAALSSNLVKNVSAGNAYQAINSDPSTLKIIANASLGLFGNNNPILTNSNFYQVLLPY
jgi:hypothetical protein